jgi:tetratricopeptide (TPR) repeat protein/nucleoside-triphosphatase THEP1
VTVVEGGRLGAYRVERRIGQGGMGAVFRGVDERSGATVALKVMTLGDDGLARFAEEARLLAGVEHPTVVRLLDHGVHEGLPFLVLEWCEAEDLASLLARRAMTIDEVVALGLRLSAALAAAHAAGVVHRDVKPSNVLVADGDVRSAKLIDFGIARPLEGAKALTAPGSIIGTPGYMAPEQARGERVDERSDLFSLGCVLYECIARRPAFSGRSPIEILAKLLVDEPPWSDLQRPDVPRHVAALVRRLLAKTPSERPPSAVATADALAAREFAAPTLERTGSGLGPRLAAFVLVHGAEPSILIDVGRAHGVRVERLAEADAMLLVPALESAADLAAVAGRVALAAARVAPNAVIAVTTGRARLDGGRPWGAAIERALEIVAGAAPGIHLDDVTRALVPSRFVVDDAGRLVDEKDEFLAPRLLLGRATPFVGRRRESAALLGHVEEAIEESAPRFVIVTGAPGIGKSRLVHEVVHEASSHASHPRIVRARGDMMRTATPFGVLQRLIALLGGEEGDARIDPLADTARVDSFAALVTRLEAAYARALTRVLQEVPLMVVIDDLHWCDAPSLDAIERTFERLRAVPFVVVATARPELFDRAPALRDRAEEVRLGPLSPRAVLDISRSVLTGADADAIGEMAAGSPFLLEELLRAKLEDRPMTAASAIVEARLDALPEPLRTIAQSGAILTQPFSLDLLAAAVDAERATCDALATRLVRADVLEPVDAGFAFRHALVREAALSSFEGEARRATHLRVARALGAAGELDPGVVASHLEAGGAHDEAGALWLRGARRTLAAGDARATLERVTRALACGVAGDERAEAIALRAEAQWATSNLEASLASAEEAVALATPGSHARAHALAACVRAWVQSGRADAAKRVAREELAATNPSPALLVRLLEAVLDLQDGPLARELERALSNLPPPEGRAASGRLHRVLARFANHVDADVERAIRELDLARADFAACREVGMLAAIDLDLAWSLVSVGQHERAIAVLESSIAECKLRGAARLVLQLQHVLAFALGSIGEIDRALAVSRAALDGYEASGDRLMVGGAHDVRAGIHLANGDLENAETESRAAVAALEPWPSHRLAVLATLVTVLVRRGALAEARALAAPLESEAPPKWATVAIALARAQLLAAEGEREKARVILAGLVAELRARAATLKDAELRERFIAGTRQHVEARRLLEELA